MAANLAKVPEWDDKKPPLYVVLISNPVPTVWCSFFILVTLKIGFMPETFRIVMRTSVQPLLYLRTSCKVHGRILSTTLISAL